MIRHLARQARFACLHVERLFGLTTALSGRKSVKSTRLGLETMEERAMPALYWVSLTSPTVGDEGNAGATFSDGLSVSLTATTEIAGKRAINTDSPVLAVQSAITGFSTATFSSGPEAKHGFSGNTSANVYHPQTNPSGDLVAYRVGGSGTVVTISLEDRFGNSANDWDYNDRYWSDGVEPVPSPRVYVEAAEDAKVEGPTPGRCRFVRVG